MKVWHQHDVYSIVIIVTVTIATLLGKYDFLSVISGVFAGMALEYLINKKT